MNVQGAPPPTELPSAILSGKDQVNYNSTAPSISTNSKQINSMGNNKKRTNSRQGMNRRIVITQKDQKNA